MISLYAEILKFLTAFIFSAISANGYVSHGVVL